MNFGFFKTFWFLGLKTILLWIVGELAGGGFMAVALSISDMWQVTCNICPATGDSWIFLYFFILAYIFGILIVLVLLTAHVKRFNVSRMRDFYYIIDKSIVNQ